MKNFLIGALTCLVAALAYGIEPVQRYVNEAANRGTLRGVEKCVEYSKSELLSQDAVKASCVNEFHKRLYVPYVASGLAGPREEEGRLGWGGTLENKTGDHVTTWVQVSVSIFDADGKEQESVGETPIWIDPMGESDFHVELPDLKPEALGTLGPCDLDDQAPKSCVSWGITGVLGQTS